MMKNKSIIEMYRGIPIQAKASIWFVLCSVVQKGLAFLTTPIFTRIMSAEEYGVVSVYNSWISILTVVLTLQLATGVYNKAMIRYEHQRNEYTSSILVLTTLMLLFWLGVYLLFSKKISGLLGMSSDLTVMLFIDMIFSEAMSLWTIRNKFEFEYKNVVVYTLLSTFLSTVGSVFAVFLFPQHKSYARICTTVLVHVLVYLVIYCKIIYRGKKLFWPSAWRYALNYNLPLIPHYLSQQILNQADRLMINSICGSAQTAMYTVAYQIAMVLNIVTTAIDSSFAPWAYQKISAHKEEEVGKLASQILIGTACVCFFFTLFAPECIYVLGGSEYKEAVWVVPPVCMSVYFIMLYSLVSTVTFYYEKTKSIMASSCIIAIFNIILNSIFIKRFGMAAAGYTTLVCYVLYAIIHYLLVRRISREEKRPCPFKTLLIWGPAGVVLFFAFLSSISYLFLWLRTLLIFVFAIIIVSILYKYIEKVLEFTSKK